mmetsp:Transcript_80327/g.134422  ORF Transcript_80327/g.134422 Transcript_80327/m.134422 type:complete len:251 (+) Transcript_80327:2704-3456(+)
MIGHQSRRALSHQSLHHRSLPLANCFVQNRNHPLQTSWSSASRRYSPPARKLLLAYQTGCRQKTGQTLPLLRTFHRLTTVAQSHQSQRKTLSLRVARRLMCSGQTAKTQSLPLQTSLLSCCFVQTRIHHHCCWHQILQYQNLHCSTGQSPRPRKDCSGWPQIFHHHWNSAQTHRMHHHHHHHRNQNWTARTAVGRMPPRRTNLQLLDPTPLASAGCPGTAATTRAGFWLWLHTPTSGTVRWNTVGRAQTW